MIRKTFTTKPKAENYAEQLRQQEGIAVVGKLGDKFRVYGSTKDDIKSHEEWGFKFPPERYLREASWKARDEVDQALALKKSMESGELYNDYESSIEAARIMYEWGELKTASDVFDFIEDTHNKYDKVMKELIDDTLEEYDYEAKEEVAKE